MAFNNWDMFRKNYTTLEINASEMELRNTNPRQAREDLRNRLLSLAITLLVLVALLVLLLRAIVGKPVDQEEQKIQFTEYVCEMMTEHKSLFWLGNRSADTLLDYKNWTFATLDTEDPAAAAASLLPGEQIALWDWEALMTRTAEQLFEDWYAEEVSYTADGYIALRLNEEAESTRIPALPEGFWLAETSDGTEYLLARDDARWGVKPLNDFR